MNRDLAWRCLPVALLLLLLVVLVRTAWVADDAQISFRTLLNWQHGWGLRWNVAERVQAYTHPLWMALLALTTGLTGELFGTTLGVCLVCSTGAAALLARRVAREPGPAAVALAALLGSKAFVDYATSGLETPLAALLLVLLVVAAGAQRPGSGRDLARVVGVAALLFLTRMDLALLAAPLVLLALRSAGDRRSVLRGTLAGLAPALAWLAFATVYYGSPLPNTAYAKLGAGVPTAELVEQGWAYLGESLGRDPLTLGWIGAVVLWAAGRGDRVARALALGAVLYLLYTVRIGGDFMSGRFLAMPFLAATLAACRGAPRAPRPALGMVAALLAAGLLARGPNLTAGADYATRYPERFAARHLIADERAYYYARTGLLAAGRAAYPRPEWFSPPADWRIDDLRLVSTLGADGLAHGPLVHLVDRMALADPLLARLPARRDARLRPGHLERLLPAGYLESLLEDRSLLADPGLNAYYTRLRLVTRGALGSWERLVTLLELNLGRWDYLVTRERYLRASHPRHPGPVTRAPEVLVAPVRATGDSTARSQGTTYAGVLEVPLESPVTAPQLLDLSVEQDDPVLLRLLMEGRELAAVEAQPVPHGPAGRLRRLRVLLPRALREERCDRVRIELLGGHGAGVVGHLRVEP